MDELESCPSCQNTIDPNGINLFIKRMVYECSCDKHFCSVCSEGQERQDHALVCPHCKAIWFDPDTVAKGIEKPGDASTISAMAAYWS